MQLECWADIKVIEVWNTKKLQRKSCDTLRGLGTTNLHTCDLIIWMWLDIWILTLLAALILESQHLDMSSYKPEGSFHGEVQSKHWLLLRQQKHNLFHVLKQCHRLFG